MLTTLVVSQILSWIVIIALGMLCMALTRQVGVLHERIAPAGALAMNQKVDVGDKIPDVPVTTLDGQSFLFGKNNEGKSDLIFFLSPDCPVCKTLLPAVKSFEQSEQNWLSVTYASDGKTANHTSLASEHGLNPSSYVISEQLGRAFGVSKLPYAVLISEEGKIASLGLVNSREHLESLVEAKERGVASIQEYLARKTGS